MAMRDYYEAFIIQKYQAFPTGMPPPFDFENKWADGDEIQGLFIQSQSIEAFIAGAQGIKTRGKFAADPAAQLQDGDVLRRVADGMYFRIIGDPLAAPAQAESQVKSYAAELTGRPV